MKAGFFFFLRFHFDHGLDNTDVSRRRRKSQLPSTPLHLRSSSYSFMKFLSPVKMESPHDIPIPEFESQPFLGISIYIALQMA